MAPTGAACERFGGGEPIGVQSVSPSILAIFFWLAGKTHVASNPSTGRDGLVAGGGGGNRNHVRFQPFEPDDDRVVSGFRYLVEIWGITEISLQLAFPTFDAVLGI